MGSGLSASRSPGMTAASEPHRPRPLDLRDRLDAMQELGRDWLVDGDEADRVAALAVAAESEGRDVDAGLAEERPEGADEAGLVGIAHVEHVRRELGVDGDVADLGHARLAVLEHGAAGMARHVLGVDHDADEALIVADRVLALDLLDHD